MTVRSLALVPVCLVWILSFGCASAKLTVIHPLPAPESRVTLSIEESSQIHSEQLSGLRTILTTRLKQGGVSVVGGSPPDVHDLSAELTELTRERPRSRNSTKSPDRLLSCRPNGSSRANAWLPPTLARSDRITLWLG